MKEEILSLLEGELLEEEKDILLKKKKFIDAGKLSGLVDDRNVDDFIIK